MFIHFVLTDSAGNNLFDSTSNKELIVSYPEEGVFRAVQDAKVYDSFPTFNYVLTSGEMMALSERGIKNFRITYDGRIDDLFLDAVRVDDGDCSHEEIKSVKFNAEPVKEAQAIYRPTFILKRK